MIVDANELNLVQLAVYYECENLVRYILKEHKYSYPATRQLKSLDPRIILAPIFKDDNDELSLVKLAIMSNSKAILHFVWDEHRSLFGTQHARELIHFVSFA